MTPEILCDKIIEEINNLRSFSNIGHIFLCKVPPRSDLHRINLKVSSYNNLVSQKLKELVNVSITDTVSLELKSFYKDGLHLSNLGLKRLCDIILSKLYSILAPDVKRSHVSKHKVCTISFERPVNYLCDAWHVFPSKYEAWPHFNRP